MKCKCGHPYRLHYGGRNNLGCMAFVGKTGDWDGWCKCRKFKQSLEEKK